jgi:hypothetical protein
MSGTENEQLLGFMFDDAMKLRNAGDLVAARQRLEALVEHLQPADRLLLSHAHTQLGHICEQLADPDAQEAHWRAAVSATPAYDLPSLGLFHTLYDQKRRTEALEEMVRFLRRKYSAQYAEMVMGMFDETDPAVLRAKFTLEQKQLLAEARQLVSRGRNN